MNVHFREEQRFRQPWLLAMMSVPAVLIFYGAYRQLALGRPWGNNPMPVVGLILFIAGYLLYLSWFLSLKLVTEVRDQELYFKFVRGWRARRIPLDQIRQATALAYSPILDYGGWGIRFGRNGMAYNVSGDRGVLLDLTNGKKVLVGSQRADDLARAIEERKLIRAS